MHSADSALKNTTWLLMELAALHAKTKLKKAKEKDNFIITCSLTPNKMIRPATSKSQTASEEFKSLFYPLAYSVIEDRGKFRLHLDLGDNSYGQKRRINFNRNSVVFSGIINGCIEYYSITNVISEANRLGRFRPEILEDVLEEAKNLN